MNMSIATHPRRCRQSRQRPAHSEAYLLARTDNRQSISSFFKRKSPPRPSPKASGTANTQAIEVFDDDEPIDVTGSPPPAKKPKTSSYFGSAKPGPSAGPSRRPSASREPSNAPTPLQNYRLPRPDQASRSQAGSAFDTFTYTSESQPRASQTRTAAQQAKHEEWHRKVVGGTLIPRRRSLALDEAAALEAKRQLGVEDEEVEIVTPVVDDGGESEEERQKTADKLGESLAAKYGAKEVKGKGKGKAAARKKKVEEVGPSGQTYTPLEKQYLEHKAQNPDVLLMMEGEFCLKCIM
jgi:DNA mismatch repair protein MSH3